MRNTILAISVLAGLAAPTLAFADGNGAVTGAAGGAITGAVVGGPVGAVVGGVAGAAVGGAISNPAPPTAVVVEPAPVPCTQSSTTVTNNNTGASRTTDTTTCN